MFGEDANWGRIIAAAGYSGVAFDPGKVDIYLESAAGKEQTAKKGMGLPFDEGKAAQILKEKEIKVIIDLQQGKEEAYVWTCDLSYEYVRINAGIPQLARQFLNSLVTKAKSFAAICLERLMRERF